ncbi:RNA 2'-phosphotransferase [Haloarcula nitratireducens]|uniref:Probable RNA 2'-phosphotransferase n=1 Tax=Haloarcula nitratireducens TaxID=2487749 RepID=A0AAW4PC13_9EURY|nr:RNA 2'-phosphotransferase [Halomicroarcula nitratireducens]MBX0295123.1 RNA 2'-phosphotransferase [Halomicroarcula nitratireducens]
MPDDVRTCDDHGFFEGSSCPACGSEGRHVVDGEHRRQLSKFVSGALRHFPEDAGLELDAGGWTSFAALTTAVEGKYGWADREALAAVVATDPKGRFERTGGADAKTAEATGAGDDADRIRAAYGHSVDVTLDATDDPVPATLYHGTAPRNLDAILDEGLKPMNRQQVHLSGSVEDALEVGRRHADDPVVLRVDAAAMRTDGHTVTQRGRATYTADRVPPRYLSRRDGE